GTDKFIFSTNDSGVGNALRDIITDLSLTAKDVIDLSDCSTNVLAFQGTKAFTAIDQVKYSFDFTLNATLVELNLDSNLATSEMQIELTGLLALTTTNFVL
ncbi:MAG: M10 family metallopeptidase C-terminal domain-containing protein, partial [Methylovulum sp.]